MKSKSVLLLALVFWALQNFTSARDTQWINEWDRKFLVGDFDRFCCQLKWVDPNNKKDMETAIIQHEIAPWVLTGAWYVRMGHKLGFHRQSSPLNSLVKVLANPNGCDIRWYSNQDFLSHDRAVFLPVYENVAFGHSRFGGRYAKLVLERIGSKKFYSSLVSSESVDRYSTENLYHLFVSCTEQLKEFGIRFKKIEFDRSDFKEGEKNLEGRSVKTTQNSKEEAPTLSKEKDFSATLTLVGDKLPLEFNPYGQQDINWSLQQNWNSILYPIYKSKDFLPTVDVINRNGPLKITRGAAKLKWISFEPLPANSRCTFDYYSREATLNSSVDVYFEVFHRERYHQTNKYGYIMDFLQHHGFDVVEKNDRFVVKTTAHLDLKFYYPLDIEVDCSQ